MPALIPACVLWVTSHNPLRHTLRETNICSTYCFGSSIHVTILFFPPVPAQHSYWTRAMAPAPPSTHTPSLPTAFWTHTIAQVSPQRMRTWSFKSHQCLRRPYAFIYIISSDVWLHRMTCAPSPLMNLICLCVWSPSILVCYHFPAVFRASIESASPVLSQPPIPERTSSTLPGPINVVCRDKVMTALWSPRKSVYDLSQVRESLFMDLNREIKLSPSTSSSPCLSSSVCCSDLMYLSANLQKTPQKWTMDPINSAQFWIWLLGETRDKDHVWC